jgi:hypothetical protein
MRKWPTHLKGEDFFFDKQEKRVFIWVVRVTAIAGGACLMVVFFAALLTGTIRSLARGPGGPAAEVREAPETAPQAVEREAQPERARLTLSNFILPAPEESLGRTDVPPFRERSQSWDRKEIERFWVPPERIGLEKLRKLNDKNIERLFEDVQ